MLLLFILPLEQKDVHSNCDLARGIIGCQELLLCQLFQRSHYEVNKGKEMWCSAREGSFVCPLKTWLAYFDLDSFFFFLKSKSWNCLAVVSVTSPLRLTSCTLLKARWKQCKRFLLLPRSDKRWTKAWWMHSRKAALVPSCGEFLKVLFPIVHPFYHAAMARSCKFYSPEALRVVPRLWSHWRYSSLR